MVHSFACIPWELNIFDQCVHLKKHSAYSFIVIFTGLVNLIE
ncbi:hypothetical protein P20311_0892 [Pseudoalteromonas sp. BSi20311]|nr:hypothetical protein PSM_A1460 [Pseudoalteromonas sp. SM9913]GAA63115.1 hypothetical protein P20311_0892 [Pseudoalteromonas sp. BSi20311]